MPVININGLKVSYNDTGDGAPVVFVPGLAGSGEWFHYQSSALADRFRVITYELRRARGADSLDTLAEDLSKLLLALKIYNAAVVGYSLGGMIALKYALAHPERCPALVLCSTLPRFPDMPDAEFVDDMLPGVRIEGFWERVWRLLRPGRSVTDVRDDPGFPLAATIRDLDTPALAARVRAMRGADLTSLLPGVDVPTLVVASSGELPYVLSGSQVLHESIPDSTLEVIETPDRFYFHTRHDLFNAVLADYLVEKIARF